ncbi:hypothetical protein LCGC14_0764260 [marine sediment metagenome]|uniref:Uncharacterized protein n=1 Tax=marine sediment metagenome TaxID=412755 RepID=A0A0F9T787_9ZZZZ
MQKPTKPERKFKKLTRDQKPLPPSKITTIVAYKPPNDLPNILDEEAVAQLCGFDYYPAYDQEYSLKDLLQNIPKELLQKPETVRVKIESSYFYDEAQDYIQVEYDIPNDNYAAELSTYQQACKDHDAANKAWREENPLHKERLKKYKEDMKEYRKWREAKIKDLEKKGEL